MHHAGRSTATTTALRGRGPAHPRPVCKWLLLTRPFSIISPANSTPRKGVPSAHMPRAVGYTNSSMTCRVRA